MSRDPLEGFRPQDTFEQSGMRPHDALDRPSVTPPDPVGPPDRRSGIRIAVLIIGMACVILAGALAFYLTAHPSSPIPRPTPTPTATATPTPSGETVVRQGQQPSVDPSSSPAAK